MKTLLCAILAALPLAAAEPIRVSSFSTILTEIAEQVGGPRVAVTAHVKPGVDPHEFEPEPADLKIVGNAQLILLSANQMEGYGGKLKEAAATRGLVIEVGDSFSLKKLPGEKDASRVAEDPHWWQSISNVEKATKIVRDELANVSPADSALFAENAAKYLDRLAALKKWARAKIAELPRDRRKLVTSHDAFQYFARENGFTIYAIEGVSSADQPSSKKVGDIIAAIRSQHVKAIFPESIENPKVLTEITRETGAKIGGQLYADGLGEGDAATYEGMYKHNVTTIVEALK